MTQVSAPQQGILVGDATEAPYSADEWSLIWSKINGFASRANYGVIFGYDNGTNFSLEVTQVTVASANVEVKQGAAQVTGTLYWSTATETLAIAANASGNARIDTVVLRKDYVAQTIRLVVRQGTPAASPVPPTLTQSAGTTWEIPLADIAVANGFSAITNANITFRHEFCNVGNGSFIDNVLNNSGVTLEDGDVVVWDTTTARAVTTTTQSNNWRVAGVWRGRTASAERGRIQTRGIGRVKVKVGNTNGIASITLKIGTALVTGYEAKKATAVTIRKTPGTSVGTDGEPTDSARGRTGSAPAQLAVVLEAPTLANNFDLAVLCYIDVQQPRNPHTTIFARYGNSDNGTFTSGSWAASTMTHMSHGAELYTIATNANFRTNNYVSFDLANSRFTIQPGRYLVRARTPGYRVDGHLCRWQDITNAVTVEMGHSAYSPSAADSTQSYSTLETFLIVETATVYELQVRCATTRATDGRGKYVGFGGDSIYYDYLEITRFDEVYNV